MCPKIDPCGMEHKTIPGSDKARLISEHAVALLRLDLNQLHEM